MHGQDVYKSAEGRSALLRRALRAFFRYRDHLKMFCTKVLSAPRHTEGECIPKTLS